MKGARRDQQASEARRGPCPARSTSLARALRTGALAAVAVLTLGCASSLRKFPLQAPLWQDPDQRPHLTPPEEYFSGWYWDAADQMVFRPFARIWAVDPAGEAINVNALDEVPDSSWFVNRIGRYPMTPAEAARGACAGPSLDPRGPWTVTGAKPNGANPGFPIKAADGRRYMVKFDGVVQGPRATAADVIVSKLYHAAGLYTPCNEIVFFDRSILRIAPDAMSETPDGEKVHVTEADLDLTFSKAIRLPDGRYRASASLFLPGKPLGPFRYEGTRSDDPNDVVPHEDRRELRGARLLAAWTNHTDSREQNTLTMWIESAKPRGYVRHNIIDFGDCLGSLWEPPSLARRIGHSSYLDVEQIGRDFFTLGMPERPWDVARFGRSGRVWGYYDVELFDPEAWQPGYPNPAMGRMSERDAAWMARIIAHLSDDHLRAMVQTGKLGDAALEQELVRILRGRRDRILDRYLSHLSPLSEPVVRQVAGKAQLCLRDLAVHAKVFSGRQRRVRARTWLGDGLQEVAPPAIERLALDYLCVDLPDVGDAAPATPRYLIVDVIATTGSQPALPARVHLYQLAASEYRIVGLERPYDDDPPGS